MTDHDDTDGSALIDATVSGLGDWRGERLAQLRALIHEAAPDIVEEVKWRKPTNPNGVPTWTCDGIVCTGEIYQDKVMPSRTWSRPPSTTTSPDHCNWEVCRLRNRA